MDFDSWMMIEINYTKAHILINGKLMYSEFTNKQGNSILKYMEKLGRDSRIYSEKREGLGPLLSQHECYVYATEH